MTAGGRPRRAPRAALSLLALAAAAGCVGERERLDVPRITLDVAADAPPAGGRVNGRAAAADASGLIALAVYACSRDSVFRRKESYDRAGSAAIDFALHVATNALPGEPVEIYAVAYDDQGFSADSAHVVHVAGGSGTPGDGVGLCTRLGTRARLTPPTPTGP